MTNKHAIVQRLLDESRMPSGPDLAAAVGAAHPIRGDHFVLGSPSLREGSKHADHEALTPYIEYANSRPGVLGVEPGVGYWADGKEESGLAWVASPAHVPAIAADLRDRFNQKAVIGFAEDREGPDAAYILHTAEKDPDKIHDGLMRHGVEYKTVVGKPHGSTVYVIDSGRVQGQSVAAWAKETGAHMDAVHGRAHFEGGDERPRPIGPTKLSRADVRAIAAGVRESPDDTGMAALRDFLQDANDPRGHLFSEHSSPNAWHGVTRGILARVTRFHQFPDGTKLFHIRDGKNHTLSWDPDPVPDSPVPIGTRTFTKPELHTWVAQFPDGDREKLAEFLKLSGPKKPIKLSLEHSLNKARRIGNVFVKTPGESGSPHAEHAAASVFKTIGLPHIPVQERGGRVYSKWIDGLKSLEDDPSALKRHADPERIGHLALGEWLVSAGDRLPRNYQTHPTLGLIGNDYGHSFHPLTNEWAYHKMMQKRGRKAAVESYNSLAQSPNMYAEFHPLGGAVPAYLRNHLGVDRDAHSSMQVPASAVAAALDNEPALVDAAHRATTDLPDDERQHAVAAMKARIHALREHVTNRGRLTVGDLVTLTQKVRDEASRRVGPRPV